MVSGGSSVVRFGVFEVDLGARELRKRGIRLRLQEQPFRVLEALLEKPGEIITREQLKDRLWAQDEFVEFDKSLNTAIQKIRQALDDSATSPRFLETVPKVGYRFVAPVERSEGRTASETSSPNSRRLAWAGVLTLLVVILIVGWRASRSAGNKEVFSPNPQPLTSYPGSERSPSFSPDGNQVAFAWDGPSQDNFDIYVTLVGGETPLRLTNSPNRDLFPAWSPDGRSIAFLRLPAGSKNLAEVRLVPAIGGAERMLTRIAVDPGQYASRFGLAPGWSPDGKSMVVVSRSSPQEAYGIFLYSLDTGALQRLTSPLGVDWMDYSPDVSPDGRKVAFVRTKGLAAADILVVPLDGGETKIVAELGAWIDGVTWTHDGRDLIYSASIQEGGYFLYRVPESGGTPARLMGPAAGKPALASRVRRLAFMRRSADYNIWRLNLQGSPESASPKRPLVESTRADFSGRLSPDGNRIAFSSARTGSREIWVCGADGSNPVRLTFFNPGPAAGPGLYGQAGTPRWSPDGKQIVFDADPEGTFDVFAIDAAGGAPRRITQAPSDNLAPSWSGDGRWIYFASDRSGEMQIWKAPSQGELADDTKAVQITYQGGMGALESPDVNWVYYAKGRGLPNAIWRIPADGGDEAPVIGSMASSWGNWTVIDGGIYYADQYPDSSPDEGWVVKYLDLSDGEISVVAELSNPPVEYAPGLDVSADQSWLLVALKDQSSSDLMVIENFQ